MILQNKMYLPDTKSTADGASGVGAEQTESPASAPGEQIQLPDPVDQFSLDSTDSESTPQSQNDNASGVRCMTRLTRSSSLTKGGHCHEGDQAKRKVHFILQDHR